MDDMATNQRFTIRTYCGDDCLMRLQTSDGSKIDRHLSDLLNSPMTFTVGAGQVYIDSATRAGRPEYLAAASDRVAGALRASVRVGYRYFFPPVLFIGVLAFVAVTLASPRRSLWNATYALALTSWLLVLTRVTLLVLIDATSFPVLGEGYLGPAYFLLVSGAVLSCSAWLQISTGRTSEHSHGAV
jgi:hypothetical protein